MYTQKLEDLYINLCSELQYVKDTDYEFDRKISDFVKKVCNEEEDISEKELEIFLRNHSNDKDLNCAYIAFWGLNVYLRRKRRLIDLRQCVYENEYNINKFKQQFKSYLFLELLCDMHWNKIKSDLIEKASAICEIMSGHNVRHAYVEIIANVYESSSLKIRKKLAVERLDQALQYINEIVEKQSDYAKYYSTQARILSISADETENADEKVNKYQEALFAINQACLLDGVGKDSREWTEEYRRYETSIYNKLDLFLKKQELNNMFENKIQMAKEEIDQIIKNEEKRVNKIIDENEKEINEVTRKKLSDNTIRNFELLGLFVAIISFVMGTLTIMTEMSFEDAAYLIIELASAMICVYSAATIVLHDFRKQNIIMFFIGVLGIIIAFISGSIL